jgi:hypothetical protein
MAKQPATRVNVVQDPDNPVPFDVMADAIVQLSKLGEAMRNSRLERKVVLLLLHDMTGINIGVIGVILDAIPQLEKLYLKQAP